MLGTAPGVEDIAVNERMFPHRAHILEAKAKKKIMFSKLIGTSRRRYKEAQNFPKE